MKNKANLFVSLFILIIVAMFILLQQTKSDNKYTANEKPKIVNLKLRQYVSGILIPEREVKIKSQISGILNKLYLKAGDTIKTGDLIAEISILPNPQNIEIAEKTLKTCLINHEKCEKEFKRYKELYSKRVIAEQEFDKYRESYLISQEEISSAKKQLQIIKKGYSQAQKNIPNFIRSTVTGTILDIPLKEGASVTERNNYNEGSTIANIADLQTLIFKAKVSESDVAYLKKGMTFEIGISALKNKKLKATLSHITPKAIEENGIMKFEIEAKVENHPDTQLYPGFSAVAEIILDKRDSVMTIKERNLIFKKDSLFVELLDRNNEKSKHLVKTGLSDGLRIEITEGLSLGDRVKVQTN